MINYEFEHFMNRLIPLPSRKFRYYETDQDVAYLDENFAIMTDCIDRSREISHQRQVEFLHDPNR